jgi:hypothetical protein
MMAHPLSTPLDAAEMLTARGWVIFPADNPDAGTHCTGSARACRERRCKAEADPAQRGKHPRVSRWSEITDPADSVTLRRWFGRDAVPANVAIACGPSGLVIVDEDHAERGGLAGAAASVGQPCPDTFTVSTHAGRRHYYFTSPIDPATGLRWPIGNAPGGLAAFGCDVRGGSSGSADAGGYVITAGSTHASGEVYATIGDPHREAIALPAWLIEMVLAGPSDRAEGVSDRTGPGGDSAGPGVRASDGARWDDAPRYGSAEDLCAQFQRHCDEVEHEGGAFRHELFLAARDGWRCVALGLLDEPTMLRTLDACVHRVWGAEPDDRDHVIVFAEAQPAAASSPWELSGPHRGAPVDLAGRTFLRSSEAALTSEDATGDRTAHGNSSVAPVTEGERPQESDQDRARRRAFERIEAERWAREALDARDRPALLVVTPKGRKDRPRASYLVPKMLYRNGLAVIFGAPGCGKSFFALDVGLSFAAGRPWRGQRITAADGGRGMVHYVMAEGEDANNLRIDAFLYHHGLTDDDIEDSFRSIPMPIMLTEAGIRDYLPYVEEDKPDLIVLDTKNLMFAGRESQGEDYGAMLRILHKLQVAAGGCTIILIDHSGLGDLTRPRGNNAQVGGVDTEIMVTEDHGLRTAEVTKDRSAELGTRWHYRLHQIDEVPRAPFIDPPAVVVEAAPDDGPLRPRIGWPMLRVSDDLSALVRKTDGKGKDAAGDVVRLLVGLGRDEVGQTAASIISMITKECPRQFGKSTIHGAVATLRTAGVIESIGTAAAPKYVIVEAWRAHVTEE